MAELRIIEPKDRAKRFKLDKKVFTIGREEGNDLVIPEPRVTKRHARIFMEKGQYYIQDLNSKNGTLVNQRKITKVKLLPKTRIRIGNYILSFEEDQPETVLINAPVFPEAEEESGQATLIDEGPPPFDFDERETVVAYRPELVEAKDHPRFYITTKAHFGTDFLLDKEEMFIGQDKDNEITLPQPFVSRRHAKLLKLGEQFSIIDQHSTNGVFVNGRRVKEKTLKGGDLVSIGSVTLRYTERGEIFSPVLEMKKKEGVNIPVMKILLGMLILAILGGALYGFYVQQRESQREAAILQKRLEENRNFFTKGKAFMDSRKWEDAIELLNKIPVGGKEYDEAISLIKTARFELENRKIYYALLDALEEDDFDKASSIAASVPAASVYQEEAMKRLAEAKKLSLAALNATGKDQMANDDWEAAMATFDKALQMDPGNEQFVQLLNQAKEGQEKAKSLSYRKQKQMERRRRYYRLTQTAKKRYNTAIHEYLKGDVDKAMDLLSGIEKLKLSKKEKVRIKAKKTRKLLDSLSEFYKAGTAAFDAGDIHGASTKWEEFLKRETQLVKPGKSKWYKKIVPKLSGYYAKSAQKKFSEGKFPLAYALWTKTLQMDPANATAKHGLEQLDQKAQDLYREAYAAAGYNNISRAKSLWRKVLTIVPPDNEYYKKAQEKLIEYQ